MKIKFFNLFFALAALLLIMPGTAYAWGWHHKDSCYEQTPVEEPAGGGSNILHPYIHLLYPNFGSEVLGTGSTEATTQFATIPVTWESYTVGIDHVSLLYSLDDGASWNLIVDDYPNTGIFYWNLPNINHDHVYLRISGYGADGANYGSDITNAPFSIMNA